MKSLQSNQDLKHLKAGFLILAQHGSLYGKSSIRDPRLHLKKKTAIRALLVILSEDMGDRSDLITTDPNNIKLLEMFSSFPQFDEDGEMTKDIVQIDWMVGNLDWLEFSHFSDVTPGDEEYIKGLHRTQLLVSLFSVGGFTFRHKGGIRNKETKEIVAKTPEEAFGLIFRIYGERISNSDVANFNSLYPWIVENLKEEEKIKVLDSYLRILNFTKSAKFKDESGEEYHCGYIPKVVEDYWIDNMERLGLNGKYICKETNPKIYNAINKTNSLNEDDIEEATRASKEGITLPSATEILEGYISDSDVPKYFMQFSDTNKLGINPKSKYNTPLGIYSYPITEEMIEKFEIGKLPFAQGRKNIIIFKAQNPNKVIVNRGIKNKGGLEDDKFFTLALRLFSEEGVNATSNTALYNEFNKLKNGWILTDTDKGGHYIRYPQPRI